MTTRRSLLIALSAIPLTPRAVFAQAKKPPIVIGWLGAGTADTGARGLTAFKEGMAALGWKEGQQFVIDARWAEGWPRKHTEIHGKFTQTIWCSNVVPMQCNVIRGLGYCRSAKRLE